MKSVQFFDAATGLWTGVQFRGADDDIAANAPAGSVPLDAVEFPHAMRLVDGALVEYQPPAPDADHEWNAQTRRWQLSSDAAGRIQRKRAAQDAIEVLERQQARAMREHAIGRGGTAAQLKKRLEDIDDQITALRSQIT